MPSYRGAQSLIDSRQNIDGTTQATTQGGRGNRFQQLYALNRASGQYYGNQKARELEASGMKAEDAARRDLGRTEGPGTNPSGIIGPEAMAGLQRQQEQARAWGDPSARAGQIQKASGVSPTEALYSSLYMGYGAGPLQQVSQRYGNLTQKLQAEAAGVRAAAEKKGPTAGVPTQKTAAEISAELERRRAEEYRKKQMNASPGSYTIGSPGWSLKL